MVDPPASSMKKRKIVASNDHEMNAGPSHDKGKGVAGHNTPPGYNTPPEDSWDFAPLRINRIKGVTPRPMRRKAKTPKSLRMTSSSDEDSTVARRFSSP